MKISVYTILVRLIVLFSFTTLTYRLWPSFIPVNRILGFLIVIALLIIVLNNLRKKDLLVILSVFLSVILSYFFASEYSINITDSIYFFTTVLCLVLISNQNIVRNLQSALFDSYKFIFFFVLIETLLVTVGFFIPSSYTINWEGRYYVGFGMVQHSFASGVTLMLALTLYLLKMKGSKTLHFIYLLPGTIAILQSGARTFLISLVIIWALYYINILKKVTIKIAILPIITIVALYLYLNSSMVDKLSYLSGNEYISTNTMAQLTSGRTEFWMIDINAFLNFNLINKVFGNGFDYVYHVNQTEYGMKIWAHNDIINLLLSIGLFGVLIYIILLIKTFYKLKKNTVKFINWFLIVSYFLVVSLINGLFTYQHYLFSFIILVLLFSESLSWSKGVESLCLENLN